MESFPFPPERVWVPDSGLATLMHEVAALLLLLGIGLLILRQRRPADWRDVVVCVVLTGFVTVLSMVAWRCRLRVQPDFVWWLAVPMPLAAFVAVVLIALKLKPARVNVDGEREKTEADSGELEFRSKLPQAVVGHEGTLPVDRTPLPAGLSRGVPYARTLLAVLILSGCVAGWLLPAVKHAREPARMSICRCRFCSIIFDAHNQAERRNRRFPGPATQTTGHPPRSWRLEGLGSWDEFDQLARYRDSEPWDSPHNLEVGNRLPEMFDCPSRPAVEALPGEVPPTAQVMITGPHAYGTAEGRKIDDFPDGLGYTIAFAEAAGRRIPWTEPRDVELEDDAISVNQPGRTPGTSSSMISSHHAGRANIVFANGSSRSISERIDPKVLRALLTADGGETIPDTYD